MSVVLFLGAGFSAPFGLPVMRNFLEKASRSRRLSEDERTLLANLVLNSRKSNAFLESSPTNLEDLLTMAVMAERLKLPVADELPAAKLRLILAKVLSDHGRLQQWPEHRIFLRDLLLPVQSATVASQFSIVTTNYDLCIEAACSSLGLEPKLPFDFDRPPWDLNRERPSIRASFGFFKLHGSLNWHDDESTSGRTLVDLSVRDADDGRVKMIVPRSWTDSFDWEHARPILVPPSYLKPEMQRSLSECWQSASRVLAKAEAVIFIGYSFPASDSEMLYFLASSFTDNPNLRRIYVHDLNASGIVQRLRQSGSKLGSHFADLLHPVDGDWTDHQNLSSIVASIRRYAV